MNQLFDKLNIFEYMEIRFFLQDFYKLKKSQDKKFSHAVWAESLGFTNKTILRLILLGKRRITLKTGLKFKKYFSFSEYENNYFDALVDYSQSKSPISKQAFGIILLKLIRKNFQQVELYPDSGVLSDVYGPLFLMVLSSTEQPLQIEDIQKYFKIDFSTTKSILENLKKSSLIQESQGYYLALQKSFKISDQFQNINLKNYYQYWIGKSSEAIKLPFEVRRYRSLQFALSEVEFDEIVRQTNEFASQLLSKMSENTIKDRKVYIFNTALFPAEIIHPDT